MTNTPRTDWKQLTDPRGVRFDHVTLHGLDLSPTRLSPADLSALGQALQAEQAAGTLQHMRLSNSPEPAPGPFEQDLQAIKVTLEQRDTPVATPDRQTVRSQGPA